ncbi:hypothetical protein [Bradyrhizobium sp. WSM1743]|uniref:hypothetical protein n=1 Tax=Bradyrhizobium sp. WSM1743 TaxID=318996 RepID=UPI000A0062B0
MRAQLEQNGARFASDTDIEVERGVLSDEAARKMALPTRSIVQARASRPAGTPTGLDSHVASNCRFEKQAATAFGKAGAGQCLTGEHRMTLSPMYRLLGQGSRLRSGRIGLATPHRCTPSS